MSIYAGTKHSDGCGAQIVTKDDNILMPGPSQGIINHSPDGFNWGYGGSGPAQLALAILYDVVGDPYKAIRHHQHFKRDFVARWGNSWQVTTKEVKEWIREHATMDREATDGGNS